MRKITIFVICVLLVDSCLLIFPIQNVKASRILYVGGSGPGNYSTIQSAIDVANSLDTVFVYSGTYFEEFDIEKSINLIGENKDNTIIDGYNSVFQIKADVVTIYGFTFQTSIRLYILSSWVNFSNNIMDGSVFLKNSEYCTIAYNHIDCDNVISSGITLTFSNNNHIVYNEIGGSADRIYLINSEYNIIQNNNLFGFSGIGVSLLDSSDNYINYNNFNLIGSFQAFFINSGSTNWNANYWSGWGYVSVKPVFGVLALHSSASIYIPWIKFDRKPALIPYEIPKIE